MTSTYFLAFCIAEVGDHVTRYTKLLEIIETSTTGLWWAEPSVFIVFASDLNIDALTSDIGEALDPDHDIAVLGKTDFKVMKVLGASKDNDIFNLVPFATGA